MISHQKQSTLKPFLRPAGRGNVTSRNLNNASSAGQEVCVVNMGPRERRQRLTFGLFSFGVGIALAAAMIAFHLHPLWRLALFFPFAGGASGYFQSADKT